ncbi:hypothetical protein LSH36_1385g00017 [Paralvinella palmiformis]|uniref:Uncharacterized protein n=1 Tax=Paralvinella palmiformis TaxID=53620 RepID=A0AAD9IUJ2_9ANNE|nr:hypothetical protein LSH36_1385g00017 [Paralvinella palmiformis]
MVDACQTQPVDKEDALGYMWYNFNRFYRGNRAPFGIHLHAVWFKQDPSYYDALATFLDALSQMNDVYLVSASQVVAWMRNPTSVKEINGFLPWRKSCFGDEAKDLNTKNPPTKPEPISTTSTTSMTTVTATTTTKRTPASTTTITTTTEMASTPTTAYPLSSTTTKTKVLIGRRGAVVHVRAPNQHHTLVDIQQQNKHFPLGRPFWLFPRTQPHPKEYSARKPDIRRPARIELPRRNDVPLFRPPPHREDRHPPRIEQPVRRPDSVTSQKSGVVLTDQPKAGRVQADAKKVVLREKLQVEIDVRDGATNGAVRKKEDVSGTTKADANNDAIVRSERVQLKNAYGSSREEATEKTYFQPSRNGASHLDPGLVVIGLGILLLKNAYPM